MSSPHSPRRVLELSGPIGLAFIPLGIALGLLVVHAGLEWWWAPVFAAVIYAGSLEFLMVPLAASGAGIGIVALTTLIVNARHVFYSLSFPLHRVHGLAAKLYSTYTLSDEAYAVAVSTEAQSWNSRSITLMQSCFHMIWVSGATMGGLIGNALPIGRLQGLDFALIALFIVLTMDAYRQRPDRSTAVAAIVCAIGAWVAMPGQLLLCAFAAFTAFLLLRLRLRGNAANE